MRTEFDQKTIILQICDQLNKGAQSYYIKEQESPYMVMGDQWVGYDDVDSLRIKVRPSVFANCAV